MDSGSAIPQFNPYPSGAGIAAKARFSRPRALLSLTAGYQP